MKNLLYILLMLAGLSVQAQGEQNLFKQANDFYNNGDYNEAIELYQKVLESDMHSAELYFNLANAYYKTNQVAPSIYYYEKALILDPKDKDIRNNLAFAQNMTIDAIEVVPEVGLAKVVNGSIRKLNFESWAGISVGLMMLFVGLFLLYYFSINTAKKRFYFLTGFVSLFLCLLTLFFAFQGYDYKMKQNPAIVFAEESDVRTDPNLRSETAFTLHEGTKVEVVESYDENWLKIKLTDGKVGWIMKEDIKLLNIF